MITPNRIHPEDKVRIDITSEGKKVAEVESTGFHNIESAIMTAYKEKATDYPKDMCVFDVHNITSGTEERYRFNAHGHLKLIV